MRFLQNASGWTLLAALVYAPWDYGAVSEPAIVRLNWMLGGALALRAGSWLWAMGGRAFAGRTRYRLCVKGGTKESGSRGRAARSGASGVEPNNQHQIINNQQQRCNWLLLVPIAALLLLGWFMAGNAKAIYDSDFFLFVPVTRWLPYAVGSIDQAVSVAMMVRVTVLLGTVLLVADLVRDSSWLLRLWWTLGLVGSSIALLGLLQKASGAQMIFWAETPQAVATFFGTYYYHGNAGAFLNLTVPLTIGLAWRALTRPRLPVVRALWVAAAVLSVVAAFSNTSRMSQALAAGMLLILAAAFLPKAFGVARARLEWPTALAGAVALVFAFYAVVQTSHLDRAFARWDEPQVTSVVGRWNPAMAASRALPEAGWAGFGPGTFAVVFPYWTTGFGKNLDGRWIYLHQDYLQTVMEWGWLGGSFFGWIFFGGIGVAGWGAARAGLLVKRERLLGKAERSPRRVNSMRKNKSETGRRKTEDGGPGSGGLPAAEGVLENAPPCWSPRQRLLVPLVLLALGSVALHALVDFPLQVASIQLYVATYVGICWGSIVFGDRVNG